MSLNPSPVGSPIAEQSGFCSLPWVQWFRSLWSSVSGWTFTQRTTITATFGNIPANGNASNSFVVPEFASPLSEEDIVVFTATTASSNINCVYEMVPQAANSITVIAKNYSAGVVLAHNPTFNIIIFRK